jgi:transposase
METFTLSRKELHRPGLLKALCTGRVTTCHVAQALGLSLRQTRRLRRCFERQGPAGLAHRTRGRPSPRRLTIEVQQTVATLMTTRYVGFNDCHLTEKLREQHGLPISRESVRRLRQALGRPAQHRRRAPHARRRRVPEAARGALVQIDGSPFAWLETRGPDLMLLGAIDDATSEILALQFRPTEDLHGYATLFQRLFTTHGLPLAVYGDRLNLLVRNDKHWSLDEQLAGRQFPTHLGRMLQDLGIAYIAAHSPQAKGRIERLWATLQDRLVSELRVRGITTAEAAQAYLSEFIADFNPRFGKPPRRSAAVWRPAPADLPLQLSCRYLRVVARDNTVQLGPRCVQLPGRRSYAGVRVEVRELLDGRLVALHEGRRLATAPAAPGDFTLKPRRSPRDAQRRRRSSPRPTPGRAVVPRTTPKTHTGRHALPAHPWVLAKHHDIRRLEQRTGRTFSRSSQGGHFH